MARKGFVFNIASGTEYNSITRKTRFRLMLDFGIAF